MEFFKVETRHFRFEMLHFNLKTEYFKPVLFHFKLKMERFNLEMKHLKFETRHFNLEMKHFKFEMERFNLEMEHLKLEMKHFKLKMPFFILKNGHFDFGKKRINLELLQFKAVGRAGAAGPAGFPVGLIGSPVFFDVYRAGILAVAGHKTFYGEHFLDDLDHFRIAAEENIRLGRVQFHAGIFFNRALVEHVLDATGAALEMRVMVGARDARNVSEVRTQPREAFQFAPVAEVPTVTRAVQDNEFALRLGHQQRAQHGNVRREAGAGGDEDDGFAGGHAVEREQAAGFRAEEHAVAVLQGEQARRELAAGDEREIKFNVTAFDAGRRDAVGAANHLVRFGGGFFRRRFGQARRVALQTQHAKLAGLEIKQRGVGPHAEDDKIGVDFLATDDGGVVGALDGGTHGNY